MMLAISVMKFMIDLLDFPELVSMDVFYVPVLNIK
jgi:hypothetical protein